MEQSELRQEESQVRRGRAAPFGLRLGPPSVPALFFLVLSITVPVLLQRPMVNSDGDLARHLSHGRYMLEHGEIIRTDPFSFTRPQAPFIGFEYGSQLLYTLAERVGGLAAVAVLAGFLIAVTYASLARLLLRRGVDPLLATLGTGLAVVLGVTHWTARPHLFSFLAVVLLLDILERHPPAPVLRCAALFTLWANLHGGFVYGLILIALYVLGSVAELALNRNGGAWRERARDYLALLLTALIATVVNPYGLGLHRHLMEFFSQPFLINNTTEFVSPNFHDPEERVFLVILLLTLAFLSLYPRRPTLPRLLGICVSTAFALIAVRNVPLFGLVGLPLLVLHLDQGWRRLPDPGGVRARFEVTAGQTSTLPWALLGTALLGVLALSGGRVGGLQIIRNHFDGSVFPVAAVARARSAGLEGRLFSDFTWGGYVLYAWPEQKIFIDGGTDFFGEDIFRQYIAIRSLAPGWRELLAKWDISLLLLRPQLSLTHELARRGRWNLWYCDSLAVVLRRSRSSSPVTLQEADSAESQLTTCAGGSSPSGSDSEER